MSGAVFPPFIKLPDVFSSWELYLTWIGTIFSETSVHRHTVKFDVLAEKLLSPSAVEARSAGLRVIGDDSVTNIETFDLGAVGSDYTNSFMS